MVLAIIYKRLHYSNFINYSNFKYDHLEMGPWLLRSGLPQHAVYKWSEFGLTIYTQHESMDLSCRGLLVVVL